MRLLAGLAFTLTLALATWTLPGSEPVALSARPPSAVRPVPGTVLRRFEPPAGPYGPGHRGVDLAARPGEEVRAALPGTVSFAGPVAGRGWVTVDHGGDLVTTYGWLDPRSVIAGQRVAAGQALGRLAAGATYLDWGARLHGDYIDPLTLLARWRAHLIPPARQLGSTPAHGWIVGPRSQAKCPTVEVSASRLSALRIPAPPIGGHPIACILRRSGLARTSCAACNALGQGGDITA